MLLFTGCKKATYLKSDVTDVTIPLQGQNDTIVLQSDVNDFEIEKVPDWVKTELNDSILILTVGLNDSKSQRKGEIVIANGDLKLNIPITQNYKATHFSLPDGNILELSKDGGTASLNLDCDGDINIENADSLNLLIRSGKLIVSGPQNDGATRKKTIKLVADEFSEEVIVILRGIPCTKCKGTGEIVCPRCGGKGMFQDYWWNGYEYVNDDTPSGCKRCGGKGMRKGSGKITCPDCEGNG